ncbi:aldo/keto reductase, partial [Lactobacillus jensenii]|uniref:aldo/keto reductase n=1 Tax=Lactobacillus jensenii TaxID=109790 RepID=UPI001F098B6D
DGEVPEKSVLASLNSGYRHFDTAAAYGNEESVGRAIKKSGIRRDELFVTTKLWNSDHGYENTKKAIDTSLMKLGLDYLDLYLIHWPNPVAMRDNWAELNSESWQAMEEAQKAGKIRAIGVSNFRKHHLDALLENADVIPAVNQIYLNPSDLESDVRKENDKHQILSEAYSPLGTGDLLGNELVNKLAQEHGKSPAQILIRWSLEHGFLPLPKSVHEEYIKANGQVFDFSLSADEMKLLDGLEGKGNSALDPDQANF